MNPPSVNFMVYAIVVLFACYSVFSLLDETQFGFVKKNIEIFCFFGKNTIYIWLYHYLLVRNVIVARFPNMLEKNILVRVIVLIAIVTLPVIVKQFLLEGYRIYRKQMQQTA